MTQLINLKRILMRGIEICQTHLTNSYDEPVEFNRLILEEGRLVFQWQDVYCISSVHLGLGNCNCNSHESHSGLREFEVGSILDMPDSFLIWLEEEVKRLEFAIKHGINPTVNIINCPNSMWVVDGGQCRCGSHSAFIKKYLTLSEMEEMI